MNGFAMYLDISLNISLLQLLRVLIMFLSSFQLYWKSFSCVEGVEDVQHQVSW